MEFTAFQQFTHFIGTMILVSLYMLRLAILMQRRSAHEKAPYSEERKGRGVIDAFLVLFQPGKMESTRRHKLFFLGFILFHNGIFTNILLCIGLAFFPERIQQPTLKVILLLLIGASLLAGIVRLIRRFSVKTIRMLSTPDDYISLIMLILFQLTGILSLFEIYWATIAYYIIAALFLVFEPFTKIRHFLYFPFARYYLGTDLARRGILFSEISTNG